MYLHFIHFYIQFISKRTRRWHRAWWFSVLIGWYGFWSRAQCERPVLLEIMCRYWPYVLPPTYPMTVWYLQSGENDQPDDRRALRGGGRGPWHPAAHQHQRLWLPPGGELWWVRRVLQQPVRAGVDLPLSLLQDEPLGGVVSIQRVRRHKTYLHFNSMPSFTVWVVDI